VSSCRAQPGCSIQIVPGGAPTDAGSTPDAPDLCTGAFTPSPDDMIDNMEDGDSNVGPQPAWNGGWYVFNDMTPTGHMVPGLNDPITMTAIGGGRCGSTQSLRMSGNGFNDWGAGMGLAFAYDGNGSVSFDMHQYDGIVFWARTGEGTVSRFRVAFPDRDTVPQGGVCDPASTAIGEQCYDNWGINLMDIGNQWKQYRVKFSDLAQRGFGKAVPEFDPAHLNEIQFQLDAAALFDVWIDDIAFTKP
jgi:hypothetical protein